MSKMISDHFSTRKNITLFEEVWTYYYFFLQNGGTFLCAVDDSNDHILSVWNWQKEKQLADVKVPWPLLTWPYHLYNSNIILFYLNIISLLCTLDKSGSETCFTSSCLLCLQCSNDSVLGAVFHPMDANLIVTCGKSHINFWTMEGNTLTKRQGLFEVWHDNNNLSHCPPSSHQPYEHTVWLKNTLNNYIQSYKSVVTVELYCILVWGV